MRAFGVEGLRDLCEVRLGEGRGDPCEAERRLALVEALLLAAGCVVALFAEVQRVDAEHDLGLVGEGVL